MSNSLETRVPFLDKKVVDFTLTLPVDYKFRDGKVDTKELLYNAFLKN